MKLWPTAARLLLAAVLWAAAALVWGANLAAGPMAGHRDSRSTLIWLQADGAATARIEYWDENDERRRHATAAVRLTAATDFATQVVVTGLAPGTTYRYRVLLDGREARVAQPLSFRTEALWMWQKHSFIAGARPCAARLPGCLRQLRLCQRSAFRPFDAALRTVWWRVRHL